MRKSELIKRWKSQEGHRIQERVIRVLQKGEPLAEVLGLTKYAGRWDLRGIVLSSLQKQRNIEVEGHHLQENSGSLRVKYVGLQSVDLSYATLDYSCWQKCRFDNVLFEETKAKELDLTACHFTQCVFRKTNLSKSFLAQNIGKDSGSFKHTDFIGSNLLKASFRFPEIEHCQFIDCRLKEVNFDGSRFKNCKFKGHFESGWINGYSIYASTSTLGVFHRVNPKTYPNLMDNVNFSEVQLDDVCFQYGVDLSRCKFPSSNNYIIVGEVDETYQKITDIIRQEWNGEDKRVALSWLENLYYSDKKKGMALDIVNTKCRTNYFSDELYDKFFGLLKSVSRVSEHKR